MLSREDTRRLAQLERQLRRDDPDFCARMEGGQLPPLPSGRRLAVTLILTAVVVAGAGVVLGVLRYWIPAAIAGFCALVVVAVLIVRLVRARRLAKID